MCMTVYLYIRYSCTYDKLAAEEQNYIHFCYLKISQNDITFEKVQLQPDGTSCGIYDAAFATTIALGDNPCNKKIFQEYEMYETFYKNYRGK